MKVGKWIPGSEPGKWPPAGRTRHRDAQASLKRLHASRTRLIGVLLAGYDPKAAGHGYQYEGYYAYGGQPARLGNR